MSDITNAADSMAAADEVAPPTMEEAQALADSGEAEGTTPEEVAQVLKSSGMKLPAEPVAAATDEEEGDDPDAPAAADTSEEDTAGEGTDTEEVANEEPVTPVPEEPAKPAPASDTPAEDKYSFEIQDANGVTFKITTGTSLEEQLGADFELKNQAQALDIMRQLDKLEAQKTSDEATAAETASKAEQAERVTALRTGWDNEVKDLTAQKRLATGEDGEARVREVYQFMANENDTRIKAGRPTIGSFEDALDKLEAKENRDAKVAADKADKDEARKKGALVGGSSAPASSATPVYRAGTARNVNQAIRAMNLL